MKQLFLFLQLLVCTASCPSCKKANTNVGANNFEAGHLKGKITNGRGEPLRGVKVLVDNTLLFNTFLTTTSAADGSYKVKLVQGTWQAYAEMLVNYNTKTYVVQLHPDNSNAFAQDGAVRNFQWKLKGQKPAPMTGTYGGTVSVNKAVESSVYDMENIAFTLIPVGALIDGSTGQTIQVTPGPPQSDTYGKLADIPIGKYELTARYNNQPLKLRNRRHASSTFNNSMLLEFEPNTSIGNNMAIIEYSEK